MSVLPVPMGRLILVHEIHVDGVVWDFAVELRVEVEQWLPVLLQAENP